MLWVTTNDFRNFTISIISMLHYAHALLLAIFCPLADLFGEVGIGLFWQHQISLIDQVQN